MLTKFVFMCDNATQTEGGPLNVRQGKPTVYGYHLNIIKDLHVRQAKQTEACVKDSPSDILAFALDHQPAGQFSIFLLVREKLTRPVASIAGRR